MYTTDQLEGAIVSALQSASLNVRCYYREPSGGRFLEEVVETPLVLVVWDRAAQSRLATSSLKGTDFFFKLYVVARNLRSPSSAALGDVSGSGIYAALDTVRQTLAGNSLGLNVQPMRWVSEKPYARDARQSVYIQEWKLQVFE